MVPSARLGKEGGTRNGARETAIYVGTRVKLKDKVAIRSAPHMSCEVHAFLGDA